MAKTEQSISEILADLGVIHERDAQSVSTGAHRLYFAGRFIDQPLYFVECDFGTSRLTGKVIGKSFVETDRDRNSRQDVIDNILSGEYRDVVTILECNPVERTCRDVTEDILNECLKAKFIQAGEGFFADQIAADRQAWAFDHKRDLIKNGV